MKHHYYYIATILTVCGFFFTSCEKESQTSNSAIVARVSDKQLSATKASSASTPCRVLESEEGQAYFEEYVDDFPFETGYMTKGTLIDNSSIKTSGFFVEGIAGVGFQGDVRYFMQSVPCTFSSPEWDLSSVYYWPSNNVPMTFWSHPSLAGTGFSIIGMGSDGSVTDFGSATAEQLTKMKLSYSMTTGTGNDAAGTKDFVLAYSNKYYDESNPNEYVDVDFFHPMAAVRFIEGGINHGDASSQDPSSDGYVRISRISINNAYSSGNLLATGSGYKNCTFEWSDLGNQTTYNETNDGLRSQIVAGDFDTVGSKVFYMIPQSLSGISVTIVFEKKKNGTWKQFERTVNLSGEWVAGKYYTYKINAGIYTGGEDITLPDNPTEWEKENVVIDSETGLMSLHFSGSGDLSGYVAPLPAVGVNIIKVTFVQNNTNNSGKTGHLVWLEDKATGLTTRESSLVDECRALPNYSSYWPGYSYSGDYSGAYVDGRKGKYTNETIEFYYYLGGRFSSVKICFGYTGSTGGGSTDWTLSQPVFNMTEIVE